MIYSIVKGFKGILRNKTARLLLLGGILRVSQGYAMQLFTVPYFDIYHEKSKLFSLLHFIIMIVTGIVSNLVTGILCD